MFQHWNPERYEFVSVIVASERFAQLRVSSSHRRFDVRNANILKVASTKELH